MALLRPDAAAAFDAAAAPLLLLPAAAAAFASAAAAALPAAAATLLVVTDSSGTLKSLVVVLNTDSATPTPASWLAPGGSKAAETHVFVCPFALCRWASRLLLHAAGARRVDSSPDATSAHIAVLVNQLQSLRFFPL
jgi:hypothetical protein